MEYNDVRHTEARRNREEMRPVRTQYGFYKVGEPTTAPRCSICPSLHIVVKINGLAFCSNCFNKR